MGIKLAKLEKQCLLNCLHSSVLIHAKANIVPRYGMKISTFRYVSYIPIYNVHVLAAAGLHILLSIMWLNWTDCNEETSLTT